MKLLRCGPRGQERPAILDAQGRARDLSGVIVDVAGAALTPAALAQLGHVKIDALPLIADDARIGPCVGSVGKFICIGLNYSDHIAETRSRTPKEPVIFAKWTSAICGPNDDIEIPRGSVKTDWEVELGVVIGTPGRYLEAGRALDHVAGYCVVNDVSEREFQTERNGTWDKGKGHDTFGPIGPWLVTADEIPDPQHLPLWLEVDGKRQQDGNTAHMIFGVAQLISYVSQFMSLQSGDIIATGTPAGVALGQTPPPFLRAGQRLRLGIDGLGEQNQRMVDAV
ncbi:MAG: fumarylacetoacetate hydrolase family protein [Steroidobacteraceae bacterium]